jgi:hypothetical protein
MIGVRLSPLRMAEVAASHVLMRSGVRLSGPLWREGKKREVMREITIGAASASLLACLAACTNPYDPAQRFVGGGLVGAGTGAAIGAAAGGGPGAALGAAIGGAAGAVGGLATTPPPPPYGYGASGYPSAYAPGGPYGSPGPYAYPGPYASPGPYGYPGPPPYASPGPYGYPGS